MGSMPRCCSGTVNRSLRAVAVAPKAVRVVPAAVVELAELPRERVPRPVLQGWALTECPRESPVRQGPRGWGLGPAVRREW